MYDDMISRLRKLVMNERQAKVYLALLKENIAPAAELHRLSNVPQNKIYAILNNLIANGFISKKTTGMNALYQVINPENSMLQFIENQNQVLDELHQLRIQLTDIYSSSASEKELSEYIEVIHGNLNVHNKFVEMVNSTKKSIYGTSCPPFAVQNDKQMREQVRAVDDFFARGGLDKTVREINENSPGFVFDALRAKLDSPEEIRITEKSPIKLYIFDEKTLMTFNKSTMKKGDELCTSIITQPNTVFTYIQLFNFLWDQGKTPEEWIDKNSDLYKAKLADYEKESCSTNG